MYFGVCLNSEPLLATVALVRPCPLQMASHFTQVFDLVLKGLNLGYTQELLPLQQKQNKITYIT